MGIFFMLKNSSRRSSLLLSRSSVCSQNCPKKHTNDTLGDYLGLFHDFFVIMGFALWNHIMGLVHPFNGSSCFFCEQDTLITIEQGP